MIRINLLEVRPRSAEPLSSILSSGRSSTFISRREAVLGGVFLALTVAILGVLVSRLSPTEATVEAVEAVAASEPALEQAPRAELDLPPRADDPAPAAETIFAPQAPPPAAEPQPAAPPAPPARPGAAPPRAETALGPGEHALTNIRATPLADRVDVFLEMPNAPEINAFRVDAPARLVFDIPATRLLTPDGERTRKIDSALVSRLRIAQKTFDPLLVRLVLEVQEGPVEMHISRTSAGVSIRVAAKP
jgi:hypothetical protein